MDARLTGVLTSLLLGLGLMLALVVCLRRRALGFSLVFVATAVVYALSSGPFLAQQSDAPHYVYLADAFVHGRLWLERRPPNAEEGDWTYYDGKWTVTFPPLPAVLMAPFVAVSGIDFNDVVFTLLLGAFNVALVYEMTPRFGQQLVPAVGLTRPARVGLTSLIGFGTVHWWVSSVGQVWFTAQIAGVTFLLLAIRETLGRGRPALACSWLCLAALARPPMLLALPVLAALLLSSNAPRQMALGLIPLGVTGLLVAWFDWARFGNPCELGYRYMRLESLLARIVEEQGSFSVAYLGRNLHYALLEMPGLSSRWPFVVMNPWGMSILASTPALVILSVVPWRQNLAQLSLAGALLVALPSLLYYNTGYMQAGNRYLLDSLPFLVVLSTLGMRGRLRWPAAMLIMASVLMGYLSVVNFKGMYFEWI